MTNHPNRARKPRAAAMARRHTHDQDYAVLLAMLVRNFGRATDGAPRLFQTDAKNLNELFLDSLPAERSVHDCSACRHFIERYGDLVVIHSDGTTRPVMWDPDGVPNFYYETFLLMAGRVRRAKVMGPFHTKEAIWGTPRTGDWTHLAVYPDKQFVYRERALTAGQVMAAACESFKTVLGALSDFTAPMLDQAIRILEADALARSERFLAPAKWLRDLHDRPKGRKGENVLWLATSTAPEGYLHPKASMIGPLLEDIAAGLPFHEIKHRFDIKMHPLRYQRPQAPPAAGNIKAAEVLVDKLGIAPALERRYARLDEIRTRWSPARSKVAEASGKGVFGHLKPKGGPGGIAAVDLPVVVMTWEKFARVVLPSAEQIELNVPNHGAFIGLTTAVHPSAPPILKWDHEGERNPVAWYCYASGSSARQWGLSVGWCRVTAVSSIPTTWGSRPSSYLSEGTILILDGAMDTNQTCSNGLFPECLKEELHGVRSTIEAYSRAARLSGQEEGSACGYDLRKGKGTCTAELRVLTNDAWSHYKIDRWD